MSFNGSNSFIDLGNPAGLQITGSMTLEAWVFAVGTPWDDGQIIAYSSDNTGWQLKTSPDTGLRTFAMAMSPPGAPHTQRYSNMIPALNTWYHVAGVYDAAARTLNLYVNGVLDNGVLRGTVSSSQALPGGVSVNIGRRQGGYYFNGVIDEVRVYNRALSQAEIQRDMNTPVGGTTIKDTQPPSTPTNLTANAVGGSQINLSWTPSSDNTGVAGYKVFRTSAQVATTATASYADTGLSPNTTYTYSVVAYDAAGNTSSQSQSATATTQTVSSGSAYPLKVGPTGRYLVDQNNVPFMIVGDSPQSLIGDLSEADARTYFANRKARGFNAAWINLLCTTYTHCNSNGTTYDGIAPFTVAGDLATPNEAYFRRADDMINMAGQYGIVVLLDPIETGGWLSVLQNNGTSKAFNYGAYLGNRYKNFPNIVWQSGNDFQSWQSGSDDALVLAVAQGIKSVDSSHIHTVELDYNVSSSLDDNRWAPLISLNAAYTYYPTYAEVLHAYNQSASTPVFMVEANYEFEHNSADLGSPAILRRQEYWTALSGATGQLYGSYYTDVLSASSLSNLDTRGVVELGYMKSLFISRQWYNLVPDQDHTTVTSGYGTFSGSGSIGSNSYVTAARTPDGSLVMAYMPTARAISVDMTRLSGPAAAQWYDPSNGTFVPISGSPFANSGTQRFSPPGNNSAGDSDWVLVLETAAP